MKIAIIGKGRVGSVLGPAFAKAGHDVVYGLRNPDDPKHDNADGITRRATRDAADWADIVVLAVDWPAVFRALEDCGPMAGKILIDCTNPLNYDPDKGLSLAAGFETSAGEMIAARTEAKVVKTLNQVGSSVMEAAARFPVRPIQFVAGDDEGSKAIASSMLTGIGFDPIDYGPLENARKLEPLAMIWIDQAFNFGMNPLTAWTLTRLDT